MGVSTPAYLTGWMMYFLCNALIICAFMLLIVRFAIGIYPGLIYKEGFGFANIVVLYILYTMSVLGLVLILSNFFDKSKPAAPAIMFIQLLSNMLFFLRFANFFI